MAVDYSARPSREDIAQQIERLLKIQRMRSEMRIEALRWLIQEQEKGRFNSRTRRTCREVSEDFYAYAEEHLGHSMPEDPAEAGKKLFGGIREILHNHYESSVSLGDKVRISFTQGRGKGWEPVSEWFTPTRERTASLAKGISIYEDWSQLEAHLGRITRSAEPDEIDLKIATLSFKDGGVTHAKLREFAQRGVRIGILIANPVTAKSLIHTRYLIRDLHDGPTAQDKLHSLADQIERLERMREELRRTSCKGDVEVRRSSLMPYAFVAACRQFVILGLFLATQSYTDGPMIVCDATDNADLCDLIHEEWDERWDFSAGKLAHADSAADMAQFFGLGDRDSDGMIVLQADRLSGLMRGWTDEKSQEVLLGRHRPFKARRWVDACDVEGAQWIVNAFVAHQLRPPVISVCYRGIPEPTSYAYEIITGGFTDVMRRDLNSIGEGWLQLRMLDDSGDTIVLHRSIPLLPNCVSVQPHEGDKGEFVRIFPRDWDDTYMQRWAAHVETADGPEILDYALILRYFDPRNRKVRFFLAGFTEVGTKAAAAYLATKWPELRQNACHDLFTIIWGPSDPHRINLWTPAVTKTFDELRALGVLKP